MDIEVYYGDVYKLYAWSYKLNPKTRSINTDINIAKCI